jgi:hypothetical protein
MKKLVLTSFWLLSIRILLSVEAFGSVFSDPGVPDGEQIVWRWSRHDEEPTFSTVTWRVKDRDGKPVYEITTDSGQRKQGKYIIGRSDLRLVWVHVVQSTEKGKSEITIEARGDHQYLIHDYQNERKEKETDNYPDGYDGIALSFSLRGFPFGKQEEVELRLTPPFRPGMPRWAWKMWKSYARLLGEEEVTVPAGTFDCYKLEVGASGGLIRRFTSEYYFWYTKEPPHYFVKYQDKEAKSVTELMEIRSMGQK